jgi:hypothetical protein
MHPDSAITPNITATAPSLRPRLHPVNPSGSTIANHTIGRSPGQCTAAIFVATFTVTGVVPPSPALEGVTTQVE